MTKEQAQKRILELREQITYYNKAYHANDQRIGDNEYQDLYNELVALEEAYPEFFDPHSPTQTLDEEFEVVEGLEEVMHETPVLSLEKANTADDLNRFFERVDSYCKDDAEKAAVEYLVENKLDGLTIVLKYAQQLNDALTRGRKGLKGERVLHTVKTIKTLPTAIPYGDKIRIRGEAIIPKAEFERLNVNGEYATSRNLAAGSIRTLDANVAANRKLDMIVYDIMGIEGTTFKTDTEVLAFLKEQGFNTVDYVVFKNTPEGRQGLIDYCFSYAKEVRPTLPFDIDGLVIKVNDLALREKMGYTSKVWRGGIAFKFEAIEASTTLRDVEVAVNRTGQVSFTAIFDAIELDGCNITRATLHNKEIIKAKDIRIGDRILVAKANDIIPAVVKAFADEREGKDIHEIKIPTECPVCGQPLVDEGALLFCYNTDCPAQKLEKTIHFVANGCMEIDGLGASTIETFIDKGILNSVVDIYHLKDKQDEIVKMEGFGKSKVTKMVEAIEASKNRPLSNVLAALSIRHLGESTAKKVAKKYGNMDAMLEAATDMDSFRKDLMTVDTVGEEVSLSITNFFGNEDNLKVIHELKEIGLTMIEPVKETKTTLAGMTLVATGTFKRFSRKEIEAKIEELGGKPSGSVSKKTTYVVAGEEAGSKLDKAHSLGVPVIGEDEFIAMIGE